MLTPERMGCIALLVLWVNTLLIAWASARELLVLRARAPGARGAAIRVGLGIAAILAGATGCTVVALRAPVFGPISTLGGAACLAFFLLVQPLGTALRDCARTALPPRP